MNGESKEKRNLILASASPRRAELLKQIGMDFQIIPSTFQEETMVEADPVRLVRELAFNKAKQVAEEISVRYPDGLVIGADTVVFLEDRILGKPTGVEDAIRMLTELNGKTHQVFTGIAVIEVSGGKCRVDYEMTRVKFRSLGMNEIEAYAKTKEPLDKAGAYGIQGKGAVLIEAIDGCYFNVVGLPIAKLVVVLQDFGFSLW